MILGQSDCFPLILFFWVSNSSRMFCPPYAIFGSLTVFWRKRNFRGMIDTTFIVPWMEMNRETPFVAFCACSTWFVHDMSLYYSKRSHYSKLGLFFLPNLQFGLYSGPPSMNWQVLPTINPHLRYFRFKFLPSCCTQKFIGAQLRSDCRN